jgi:protein SMG6
MPLPKSPRPATTPRPPQLDQHRGQRVHSPGPAVRHESPRTSEYHRGPPPDAHRALYDPSQPQPTSHVVSSSSSRHQRSEPTPPTHRHEESGTRRHDPSRALFDPTQHDPIQFHGRLDAPSLSGSGHGSTRSFPRVNGRSKEEEMDRERERRRRKEGSERGMAKKKDSGDNKSKGSRSSEGSESFKDRERGKGRS